MSHFLEVFWTPSPRCHTLSHLTVPLQILCHTESNPPPAINAATVTRICNITGTCLHRAAKLYLSTYVVYRLSPCKTNYVKQQMGHANSKSSQKLAVCQWCIVQLMSQNFSAESCQCSTLIFIKRDVTQWQPPPPPVSQTVTHWVTPLPSGRYVIFERSLSYTTYAPIYRSTVCSELNVFRGGDFQLL